jgi:hypothetical protein
MAGGKTYTGSRLVALRLVGRVQREQVVEAVKDNRQGHRDTTMILLAYRHALRASELAISRKRSTVTCDRRS